MVELNIVLNVYLKRISHAPILYDLNKLHDSNKLNRS
jgi:hypothetical protein